MGDARGLGAVTGRGTGRDCAAGTKVRGEGIDGAVLIVAAAN